MKTTEEVTLNGVVYVPKSSIPKASKTATHKGRPYVLIRTYSAGVHVGYLKKRTGKEVALVNSRRIWSWAGAASLSQLAMEGTKKPGECKFSVQVNTIKLTEAIEIIEVTEAAKLNIEQVAAWKQ